MWTASKDRPNATTAGATVLVAAASALALSGLALSGLALTGTADAAPPATTTTVTAVSAGDVHAGPSDSKPVVSHVVRDNSYKAQCWADGDPVTVQGVTRANWVKLQLDQGGAGYVNTVYLKGDEHGDVPNHC
ncbi:MAG: hypothetical protein QOG76_4141 [Pseudonocardiales bacterium]|nr:hypothetical protein [Pseudonocardiales bacterium]